MLHEDKKYYPSASEIYPDAETLVQEEDTQVLMNFFDCGKIVYVINIYSLTIISILANHGAHHQASEEEEAFTGGRVPRMHLQPRVRIHIFVFFG